MELETIRDTAIITGFLAGMYLLALPVGIWLARRWHLYWPIHKDDKHSSSGSQSSSRKSSSGFKPRAM